VRNQRASQALAAKRHIHIDVGQLGIRLVALQVWNKPQTRKANRLPIENADKGRQYVLTGQHARCDLLGRGTHMVEQIQQTRQFGRVVRRRLPYP
jgi:hypothetical protein